MDKPNKQTGLWIDAQILFSNLTVIEKVILSDILVLSKGTNKYLKSNSTIAKTFVISTRTVRRVMATLLDRGFIRYELTRPYGNVKTRRVIYPCYNKINEVLSSDKCSNC